MNPPSGPKPAPKPGPKSGPAGKPRKRLPTGNIPAEPLEIFDPPPRTLWQRLQYPLRWLGIASLISVAIWAFRYYGLNQYIDQEALQAMIVPLGPWAPVAFIALFTVAMLLVIVPYSWLAIFSALVFGPIWGTLWTVLGGTSGAVAMFLMTRRLGRNMMARRAENPRWKNLNQRLEQDGLYYLLLLRTLSIVPFNLLNAAAAMTSIRLRDFVIANLVGIIPSAFFYGYGTKILLDPNASKSTLFAIVGLGVLILVTPLVFRQALKGRRRRLQRHAQKTF